MHQVQTEQRLDCSNQNRTRRPRRLGHRVQAPPRVDHIDIRMPRRPKHRCIPTRHPPARMTRRIAAAQVRLHLDDPAAAQSRGRFPKQQLPNQLARHHHRHTIIELSTQSLHDPLCAYARTGRKLARLAGIPFAAAFNSFTRFSIPLRISKSLGNGDSNAGRSGIGTSSIRYTVPGTLIPYVATVKATAACSVVGDSFGSSATYGIDFRCSRAGWLKLAIGSLATIKAASASRRASTSAAVYSPGLKRGYPRPKFTPNGYPVRHVTTLSAPVTL